MPQHKAKPLIRVDGKVFYSAYRAAELMHVSRATVLRWVRIGALKAARVGSRTYIQASELRQLLTEGFRRHG